MLWAVLNLIAISTIYIPYIGLVSAAYEIGEISASRLVAAFCIVSIVARFALISTEDHGFRKTRLLFVVGCVGALNLLLGYLAEQGINWVCFREWSAVHFPQLRRNTRLASNLGNCCRSYGRLTECGCSKIDYQYSTIQMAGDCMDCHR